MGLKRVMVQTDNGSEFVGGIAKKEPSEFTLLAQKHLRGHLRIPPGAKTYNSDVESFHRRVEEEFYRIETISSQKDFLCKAYAYMLWFDYQRSNRYKQNQNPSEIFCSLTDSRINKQIFVLSHKLLMKSPLRQRRPPRLWRGDLPMAEI